MELTAQSAFNLPKQNSAMGACKMGACNMTMSRFGDANEDWNPAESIQQTTEASHKAARTTVDETAGMAEAAAGAGDRAVQAGGGSIQGQPQNPQQTKNTDPQIVHKNTQQQAEQ